MEKKPKLFKLILAGALTFLAAFGLWALFGPSNKPEDPTERYRITTAIDAPAIERMVEIMREEPEFAFYFNVLDNEGERQVREEATAIILQSNSSADLLASIKEAYAATQNLGATFYFMEYDEDFARQPGLYPQLDELYWGFIKEEFKLAILGVFYKVHYDAQFAFAWDELTISAAQKLRQIHGQRLEQSSKN